MPKGLFENTKSSMNEKKIELYTPKFMVDVIIPFLKKLEQEFGSELENQGRKFTIWAPFDLESSNFVRYLREEYGYKVIHSHILTGQDFMEYEPDEQYDVILSNPPFKGKAKWVERASELGCAYAFILPLMWMNDISWNKIHKEEEMEIIIPDQRISFDGSTKTASFKSAYFTSGFDIGTPITLVDIKPVNETIPMYAEVKELLEGGE